MKKNWIYLFLFMAFAVMPLTSCDNDDDPKIEEKKEHDPESDADQIPLAGYDALEWLQGNIVVVGENNEVVRRIYGEPLDESQPTVISVPVEDLNEAKETFLGWVAPEKSATEVEGGYDYNLTDAEGKAQGSVSFRAVEGEEGVIARMSVAEGTDLKLVSEVKFIDADLWPENASVPVYQTGHIYSLETYVYSYTYKKLSQYVSGYSSEAKKSWEEFYCIQGNMDSKEAILIWLSPESEKMHTEPKWYGRSWAYLHFPTVPEAEKVLDFFNKNKAKWDNMLKVMDERGHNWSKRWTLTSSATGNYEFILNGGYHPYMKEEYMKFKCLDLDSHPGEICDVPLVSEFGYHYRYMQVRIVPRKHW